MAITFTTQPGDPWFALTHDALGAFHEEGRRWHSVRAFALAMRFDDRALQDEITRAWKPDAMDAVERTHAARRVEGWAARESAYLRRGALRKFEAELPLRALLLSTGDESLVCDDDPELAAMLVEARAACRSRAGDPEAVQCEHQEAVDLRRVCVHLIDSPQRPNLRRRFTGRGVDYALVCERCAGVTDLALAPMRHVCWTCMQGLLGGARDADVGSPEVTVREGAVRFEFTRTRLTEVPAAPFRAVTAGAVAGEWIALDATGTLRVIDGSDGSTRPLGALPDGVVGPTEDIDLHVSRDGSLVAVVEAHGRLGAVVDTATGAVTMRLARGEYHIEHCRFPVAFFTHRGRLCLAHATDWNRLDVSDPRTGELLTPREFAPYESGGTRPAHYLDYFHGALHVSPDETFALDDGWVWHPVGIVRAFSLARWLDGNVWESEDGPSVHSLSARDYHWDAPMCWIDAHTAAVWGLGEDDLELVPGVELFDVRSGERSRTLVGQPRGLAFDRWLYGFAPGHGSSLWDIATGDRLCHAPEFVATGYHRAGRCLWALEGDTLVTACAVEVLGEG